MELAEEKQTTSSEEPKTPVEQTPGPKEPTPTSLTSGSLEESTPSTTSVPTAFSFFDPVVVNDPQDPFAFLDEGEPDIPDFPAGGETTEEPTEEPTETPETPTEEPTDPKETLQSMVDDPRSFLADNQLEQQFTEQQIEEGEIQDPTEFQAGAIGDLDAQTAEVPDPVSATEDVNVTNFEATLIDPSSLTKAIDEVEKLDPMKAASMAEHLDELLEGMEEGNVPLWARPAVTKVEQMLAARGLGASSIGRDSLFNAIIQAAMPIAQQDASFEQEAYKTTYTAKVQAIMSDVNMEFAAKQFNATSKNQMTQFKAQLQTQVDLQNAARKDSMAQFNAQMQMSGEQFNASQVNSMTQVTAQLQAQREQFNAQMSSQIEQSNVNWRRQVNQINTAGINAVNQANVQNAFNLSNQALTFLWQEMRDEAHWEFQAGEAEKDRKAQLEASILANETAMGGEIGETLESIFSGSRFISSFLESWGD